MDKQDTTKTTQADMKSPSASPITKPNTRAKRKPAAKRAKQTKKKTSTTTAVIVRSEQSKNVATELKNLQLLIQEFFTNIDQGYGQLTSSDGEFLGLDEEGRDAVANIVDNILCLGLSRHQLRFVCDVYKLASKITKKAGYISDKKMNSKAHGIFIKYFTNEMESRS